VHGTRVIALALAVALLSSACREAKTYSVDEVKRAFAAEGISLDRPNVPVSGDQMAGERVDTVLTENGDVGGVEVLIFDEADAYDRVHETLPGDVPGRRNVVVLGTARGKDARVEAALRRLR
jgi:hypothetical protein